MTERDDLVARSVTLEISEKDGYLLIKSANVPGLILCHKDQDAVWRDLGPVIQQLLATNGYRESPEIERLRAALLASEAKVAAMQGALAPFSREADQYAEDVSDTLVMMTLDEDSEFTDTRITVGDFRLAREALSQIEQDKP